jgi:biopolymer transport protein ExbD
LTVNSEVDRFWDSFLFADYTLGTIYSVSVSKGYMNLTQVRESFAAPVAGLLLVLLLWFLAAGRPRPAVGLRIPMVKLKQHSVGYVCEDDLPIILRLTVDGQMWINQTKVAPDRLGPLVAQIVRGRDEFAVYVMADPSVPYGQFAQFLDRKGPSGDRKPLPGESPPTLTQSELYHVTSGSATIRSELRKHDNIQFDSNRI